MQLEVCRCVVMETMHFLLKIFKPSWQLQAFMEWGST